MAFVGRMNSRGKFIDCEVVSTSYSKIKVNTTIPIHVVDEDNEVRTWHSSCSRTYIKSYDSEALDLRSSPSTVRYVERSASPCELNSMADTEMSTLRCSSPRSLETETSTLTPECSTDSSSMSEGSGDAVAATDLENHQPPQPLMLKHCEGETQQPERGSTTSMCSWEAEEAVSVYTSMDSQPTETGTLSYCVPLLELGSDTTSLYNEQQSQLDQLKQMRRSGEAYDNWLSAKRQQYQFKQQQAREQRQLQQQKEALRQQLNEQRVQEWCERKARQCANTSTKRGSNTGKVQTQIQAKCRAPARHQSQCQTQTQSQPHSQLDEVAMGRLQRWEVQKIQQTVQRRQLQQRDALRKQREQQQRKQQAALAWQRWIKGVAQRPKPVPLNQGMQTLRGTISDIYINPNRWLHINEKL